MTIRKATSKDIDSIEKIYDKIHTAEEEGKQKLVGSEEFIQFVKQLKML